MTYAINLVDYITHGKDDLALKLLLGPVLIGTTVIETNKVDFDHGTALLLNCDDERGAAICELIKRKYPRNGKYMRLYYSKGDKGWKRAD
jgi:hypothetical protein